MTSISKAERGQTAKEATSLPQSCQACGAEATVELAGSHFCVDCYYLQGSCCAGACDIEETNHA